MSMQEQVVVLNVKYDPATDSEPATWDWPALLETDPTHVQVVMTGVIVDSGPPDPEAAWRNHPDNPANRSEQ